MSAEIARHRAELALAEPALEAAGYSTELTGSGDSTPELVVHFDADDEQRPRGVRLGFVPTGDEDTAVSYLQFWSPLPFTVSAAQRDDVRRAIAIVDEHTAIGRFGLDEDANLYFRFVLASRLHTSIDDDLLAELVAMVEFHQEHYGDYFEGVLDGSIAIEVLDNVIRQAG